jgi:transketolase
MKLLNEDTNFFLKKKVKLLKKYIIEYTKKKSSFLGSCFSCLEILVYISYFKYNFFVKKKFRPRFIFSKGHAAPSFYSILYDKKIISKKIFLSKKTYWHPNKDIKFIDFQTGALGHGLPVGLGMSKYYLTNNKLNKIVVLIGDGELNEGSIWESFFIAIQWKLKNLIIIIDKNKFQANEKTSKILSIQNEKKIFKNLGFQVLECDGHNFFDINKKFKKITNTKPVIIIANTLRNHGIKKIENKKEFWFLDKLNKDFSKIERLVNE